MIAVPRPALPTILSFRRSSTSTHLHPEDYCPSILTTHQPITMPHALKPNRLQSRPLPPKKPLIPRPISVRPLPLLPHPLRLPALAHVHPAPIALDHQQLPFAMMLLPHRGRDEVIAALGNLAHVAPQPVLFVLLAGVTHLGWLVDFSRDRDAGEGGVLDDEGAGLQEELEL